MHALGLIEGAKHTVSEVLAPYGWVFVVSFLVTAVCTPLARKVALRLRVVDKPDSFLKPHGRPIAYLGGVAIYLGWLAGCLFVVPLRTTEPFRPISRMWLFGALAAGGAAMLVGLVDDLRNLKPWMKLLGQVLAAVLLLAFGIGTQFFGMFLSPLKLYPPDWLVVALSVPFVVALVLAASNATNLLDGLDGLCSGVTGVIAVCFLVLATHLAVWGHIEAHDTVRIVISLAMFGAVCGFLPYNYNPAVIFMGDAGSLLLGTYAATMMLMFGDRGIARWVLGAIMIFGLPILDTSLALIRRIRLHRPIFSGDRSHLYDQLVDRGFSVRQTVLINYGLAGFYGLTGLAIIFIRTRYALLVFAAVAAATLLACARLGFLSPKGGRADERTSGHDGMGTPSDRPAQAPASPG